MLTDDQKKEALAAGVYNWMVDHPLSAADGLAIGAEKGIARWLNEHAEDHLATIAGLVVDRIAGKKS